MSDDEKFDQWLREAAADYNRPPAEVPRDAMWEAIARAAPHAPSRPPAPAPAVRRFRPWWQYAAAAGLFLAAGVAIGRGWSRPAELPPFAVATAPGEELLPDADSPSYRAAMVRHFSRAEALLTSFRNEAADEADPAFERWARDLLGDTRLLLDSPAAADLRRRQLLEDLELVLAQIVQLPAESAADRNLVRRSIERVEVLPRIRSNIPAGIPRGT